MPDLKAGHHVAQHYRVLDGIQVLVPWLLGVADEVEAGKAAQTGVVHEPVLHCVWQTRPLGFREGEVFRKRQSLYPDFHMAPGQMGGVLRGQHVRVQSRDIDIPPLGGAGHGFCHNQYLGLVSRECPGDR